MCNEISRVTHYRYKTEKNGEWKKFALDSIDNSGFYINIRVAEIVFTAVQIQFVIFVFVVGVLYPSGLIIIAFCVAYNFIVF